MCCHTRSMAYKDVNDARKAISAHKHYLKNKSKYRDNAIRSKERMRVYVRSKKDVPCHDCGIRYPYYVMQFDHLGDKMYSVANLVNYNNYAKINAEIAKCEVVCANCHAERTHRRGIAQLVEQWSPKPCVVGSSPATPAKHL